MSLAELQSECESCESNWTISGSLELSNMTEVKLAISGEEGQTFLPKHVLGYYDYLRSVPIENLRVTIPLADSGYSNKLRFALIKL